MDTKGSFYMFWAKTAKHRSPGSVTRDVGISRFHAAETQLHANNAKI